MKVEIDEKIVNEKVDEISHVIDGMRVPELLATFGSVIVRTVTCISDEYPNIDNIVRLWLENLASQVMRLRDETDDEDEDEEVVN